MTDDKLITILEDFGLSDNEARVYLAALSLGPTTILKLSRATGTKRTTVYSVVESLKQNGLMSIEVRGFKTCFVAESPQKIESIISARKEELDRYLPNFLALYNLKGSQSLIKYYEGLKSVKSVYEKLLDNVKPKEDYLVIANQDYWLKQDPDYFHTFTERRAKLNIKIRMLLVDSKLARWYKKRQKNFNEKIKLLPKDIVLTTNIIMIPKRIVFHHIVPPIMAMIVENKSLINTQRELFEIIWKSIK